MSKMAVIYWSMTGNTQAMAEAITASYDLSAREHIAPLVDCVTGME